MTAILTIWLRDVVSRAGFRDVEEFAQVSAEAVSASPALPRGDERAARAASTRSRRCRKSCGHALVERGVAFSAIEPMTLQRSKDGQTTKGLFRLRDGKEVEAVLMEHYGDRTTVCISSQAGCAFACAFCSTGQAGFTRNLSAGEIFDQAWFFARELAERGKRITNVVFMGMGEPFHNYDAVMEAVALAQRSARLRPRPSAHHDLDGRPRRQDRPLRRRARAGQSRDLAARAERRAALAASCRSTGDFRSRS